MTEIIDDNSKPGIVIQEIQAGYKLGERLLRPVLVAVIRKSEKQEEKDEISLEEKKHPYKS